MGSSQLFVDLMALRVFQRALQSRLDEALAALARLDPPHGAVRAFANLEPLLGEFDDALRTNLRHRQLREDYVVRLRGLVDTLRAARSSTDTMIEKFASAEELNVAQMRQLLHRVDEELEHGPADGR